MSAVSDALDSYAANLITIINTAPTAAQAALQSQKADLETQVAVLEKQVKAIDDQLQPSTDVHEAKVELDRVNAEQRRNKWTVSTLPARPAPVVAKPVTPIVTPTPMPTPAPTPTAGPGPTIAGSDAGYVRPPIVTPTPAPTATQPQTPAKPMFGPSA